MPKKKRKKLPKEAEQRLKKKKEELEDKDLDKVSGGTQAYLDSIATNVRLPPKRRDVER